MTCSRHAPGLDETLRGSEVRCELSRISGRDEHHDAFSDLTHPLPGGQRPGLVPGRRDPHRGGV
jgi:hypothetical protein